MIYKTIFRRLHLNIKFIYMKCILFLYAYPAYHRNSKRPYVYRVWTKFYILYETINQNKKKFPSSYLKCFSFTMEYCRITNCWIKHCLEAYLLFILNYLKFYEIRWFLKLFDLKFWVLYVILMEMVRKYTIYYESPLNNYQN